MMWTRRILLLALVSAEPLLAQSFLIGVRAGQASSRQSWKAEPVCIGFPCISPTFKTESRPSSATSGLSATLEVHEVVAIETELLFVEKGMVDDQGPEVRMEYLELPVLLRLALPVVPSKSILVFANGGFAPAREISCQARRSINSRSFVSEDCGFWRETKRDFGWVAGTGLLIRRPAYQVTLSWRRTQGARDLMPDRRDIERFNYTNAFLIGFAARAR